MRANQEDVLRLVRPSYLCFQILTRLAGHLVPVPTHLIAETRERRADVLRRCDELFVAKEITLSDHTCELVHIGAQFFHEATLFFCQRRQWSSKAVLRHADHRGIILAQSCSLMDR